MRAMATAAMPMRPMPQAKPAPVPAPYLLEQNLVRILKQDYNAELRVENIAVNPFALSLQLNGLEFDHPNGEPGARIGEIYINLQLSSLFRLVWLTCV